jgi:hypothetical protein
MPGVKAPGELVVFERRQAGQLLGNMGYPDYRDYRDQLKSFSAVAAEAGARVSFSGGGASERVAAALVSGNYFRFWAQTRPQGACSRKRTKAKAGRPSP